MAAPLNTEVDIVEEPNSANGNPVTAADRLVKIHALLDEVTSSPWSHDALELAGGVILSLSVAERDETALVWLLIVGGPSSDKTFAVLLLKEAPGIFYVDLRARDEGEREGRRRKEHARVEYLRARFGGYPILAITTRDVEATYEDLRGRTVGQGEAKRLVAVATVNRYMKLLHAVLRLAVSEGSSSRTRRRPSIWPVRTTRVTDASATDEHARLMEVLPSWFRPLIAVAVLTGMRRGNSCGSGGQT
jgi:hypothetical protein